MNRILIISVFSLILLFFVSCAEDVPEHLPSLNDVFNVTDTYLMEDGVHLLMFNSNYDRRYTAGTVSVYNMKAKTFEDMILVGNIGGKMFVDESKSIILAATRDKNRVYGIKYSNTEGKISFSYIDENKKYIDSFDEPYVFASDKSYVYLGHMRNGEISVIDTESFEVKNVFKSYSGITDIKYSEIYGALLVSHKSSPYISIFKISYTNDSPSLKRVDLKPLSPFTDDDVRGIVFSSLDSSVFYVAARNGSYDTDFIPSILKMKIDAAFDGSLYAETISFTPVYDSIGELTVVPSNDGTSELVFISAKYPDRLLVYNPDFEEIIRSVDTESITIMKSLYDDCSEECDVADSDCYICPKLIDDFECDPYQLMFAKSFRGNRLFVSCFAEDAVAILNCDFEDASFLRFEEVIK